MKYNKFFPLTIALLFYIDFHFSLSAQCSCTNCPFPMPDNFVGTFPVNITGATNPVLGEGGQGVCGVSLHFEHEYLGDLSITLTAPDGSTLQLVGPSGFWEATDGTTWDIDFTRCSEMANPDPGFSDTFNSEQYWGINGLFTGTYYPSSGCLESLTGPVNGLWSINIVDEQEQDIGNLIDYSIQFCDPSGLDCADCVANGGSLPQLNVESFEGSNDLALSLSPIYNAPNSAPDTADYSYTYIINGQSGSIMAYEDNPDLRVYPPGIYTVYGLSYLTSHYNDLPAPGTKTIALLREDLYSTKPSFCGKTSSNHANVLIKPNVSSTEEGDEISSTLAWKASPNPTDGLLYFRKKTDIFTGNFVVEVFDVNGKRCYSHYIPENVHGAQLDISKLAAGLYIMRACGQSQKIVVLNP